MALVLAKTLPIVEPVPISDTICSGGLVLIQDLGFGARFVVCNRETMYEVGVDQLVVKEKIVLPWHVIWPGISMAANFMARSTAQAVSARLPKLVRG